MKIIVFYTFTEMCSWKFNEACHRITIAVITSLVHYNLTIIGSDNGWSPVFDLLSRCIFQLIEPSDAYICVGNLTIIGSDNGLRLIGAKPLPEPMLE